jgi:hypothetical protein
MSPVETLGQEITHREQKVRRLYRNLLIAVCIICFATMISCAYIVYAQVQMLSRVAQMGVSIYDMRQEVASMYLAEISDSMATDSLGKVIHKFDRDERNNLATFTTAAEARVQQNNRDAEIGQQTTKQIKDQLDGFQTWLSQQLEQLNPRIDALNQDIMATRKNSAVSRDLGETNRRKLNLIQKRAAPTPRPSPGIKWPWQH